MRCPASLENYDYGIRLPFTRELNYILNLWDLHKLDYIVNYEIGNTNNIWFKTEEDLNVAKILL